MKIKRNKLFSRLLTPEGVIIQYSSDLSNIESNPENEIKIRKIASDLRLFLRCLDNLKEARTSLIELEIYLEKDARQSYYQYIPRALFSHAVVTYGSCFEKGGKERKPGIGSYFDDLKENPTHKEIMIYRNKLIAHLDENSNLREDRVNWLFQSIGDEILPSGPELSSFKTLLQHDPKQNQWILHIEKMIQLIEEKVSFITINFNEFLKVIKIDQSN